MMTNFLSIKQRVDDISENSNLDVNYMPVAAKIEISGICTLNCKFCYNALMKKKHERQRMMTLDDFNLVLRFLKTIPTMQQVGLFYLGESALNKNMPQFFKLLKDVGYFTFLTTNGTIFQNVADAIPYIDSLKVSWNYASIDDFKMKTNANIDTYELIRSNILKLYDECHKFGKKLNISTVLDTCRQDYNTELSKLKYDEHYWIPLQTQCGTIKSGLDGVVGEDDNIRSYMPCWSLFKSIYIDADLNLRTCTYGHYNKHIVANLKNCYSYKLFSKVKDMREKHLAHQIPYECNKCLSNMV